MTFEDFIQMVKAIDDDRPFSVGFQLQHSSTGGMTIQGLVAGTRRGELADLMERIAAAEPPVYEEALVNDSTGDGR